MKKAIARTGFSFPLVMLAVTLIAGMVTAVSSLNQGLRNQIHHTNNAHLSYVIGYSALSRILGRLHASSWDNRAFKAKPYSEYNQSLNGGIYDLWVEDSPGKNFQADIFVRTTLAQQKSLFFWRVTYQDDLFDISNKIIVDFYCKADPNEFPKAAGSSFGHTINDLIAKRRANQKNANLMAMSLSNLHDPQKIVAALGGRPLEKFNTAYPITPGGPEDIIKQKENAAVAFPSVHPPLAGELPDSPGPGPIIAAAPPPPGAPPAFPLPSDNFAADKEALEKMRERVNTISEKMNADMHATFDNYQAGAIQAGHDASRAAHEGCIQVVDLTEKILQNGKTLAVQAPGSDAAKAVQEMVVNTTASALNGIQQQMTTYNEKIVQPNSQGVALQGTSAEMKAVLEGSKIGTTILGNQLNAMKELADEVAPMVNDPEIQQAIQTTIAAAQAQYDKAMEEFKKAEEAIKKKEEGERAAANNTGTPENPDGAGSSSL
jgi:hypothetical protein